MIFLKPLQGSQFRKFRDFILNIDHGDQWVGIQECVETSPATTGSEFQVKADGLSSYLAPKQSYAAMVAGSTGSFVTNQCSEVNVHRNC